MNADGAKSQQAKLFKIQHKTFELPKLNSNWIENAYDEMELLGFPLCNYFNLVADDLANGVLEGQMKDYVGKDIMIYGSLVTTRFNKTSQGKLMRLSTFIDQNGDYFDAVHFTDVVEKYPINGLGGYACYEHHHFEKKTYPFYIYKKDKSPLILAGLFSEWINPDTHGKLLSFSIVTTTGNPLLAKIHNNPKHK